MTALRFAAWVTGAFSLGLFAPGVAFADTFVVDQGYVDDQTTGLDWIDLSATEGLSFDTVYTDTQTPGNAFYGWSIATLSQSTELMNQVVAESPASSSSWEYALFDPNALTYMYGEYFQYNASTWTPGDADDYMWSVQSYIDGSNLYIQWSSNIPLDYQYEPASGLDWGSTLLVESDTGSSSPASAPEPTALMLLGSGVVSLGALRRRRKVTLKG